MKQASDSADYEKPSKSERKRQATRLQNLGRRLVELGGKELAQVPLDAALEDAIAAHHRISSREAQRRQLQFIGKLMRDIDTTPIEEALDVLDGSSAAARYQFHALESWRDRLMTEPDALTEYLDEHPQADRQRLRQQLARIAAAADDATLKKLARALFRLLREFDQGSDDA